MSIDLQTFTTLYWSQYILIEKEFVQTTGFVTLDDANRDAFSIEYSKLLLEIGSEVDVVAKVYCQLLDSGFKKNKPSIADYQKTICDLSPRFCFQSVAHVDNLVSIIRPWYSWNSITPDSPTWWTVYNKVKHDRYKQGTIDGVKKEYYKFANQFYTLSALAGLYQLLMSIYLRLAKLSNKKIRCPLPGSRVLTMSGGIWSNETIYSGDSALYINDDGHLIQETGSFLYH